jgi:glycosyltransferase involved in cell wall biosynthesis
MNSSKSISRIAPCPCGSGKRYKDCHGVIVTAPSVPEAALNKLLYEALAAQQANQLDKAADLYEQALVLEPRNFDAIHMLGVVCMERQEYRRAIELLLNAAETTNWSNAASHNLGLAIGRTLAPSTQAIGLGLFGEAYRNQRLQTSGSSALTAAQPLISVVMPSYNHARYIETAIKSVQEQAYTNWELLIIDDGSSDQSPVILERIAKECQQQIRVLCRGNKGAPATLNELVALAKGEWIQPLNSDDHFLPNRLSKMLNAVTQSGAEWAFGGVRCMGSDGQRIDEMRDPRVFAFRTIQSELPFFETLSQAFFFQNPAISTGNLFFRKTTFDAVGGFANLRYHHDWDFCLAAARLHEPTYVDEPTYVYRIHESNTISEASTTKQAESDAMMRRHIELALTSKPQNAWMPAAEGWGFRLIGSLLNKGLGRLVDAKHIKQAAALALEKL